jgi:cytochrome c oxidase subunit II
MLLLARHCRPSDGSVLPAPRHWSGFHRLSGSRSAGCRASLALPLLLALPGCATAPSYLSPHGVRGEHEAALGWILLIIASAVCLVVAGLVLAAIYRRRDEAAALRPQSEVRWVIVGGIAIPAVILVAVLILAMTTLRADASPPSDPVLSVQVIGHRWWWELRYAGTSSHPGFITANEIHVPVGQPVRLQLATADVIHSFWIPQLAGKTDLIPGQRNVSWIEADSAGTYWGQCGEYCGLQHANMQLYLEAESPGQFAGWLAHERQDAAEPPDTVAAGRRVFERSACAQCHTIRGTTAGGSAGPDLTHLASRHTIAGGMLRNTPGNLAGWIANPQAIKPGTAMPVVPLSPREFRVLLGYLVSLH